MQFRVYVQLFIVFIRNQPTNFNETLHVPTRGKNTHLTKLYPELPFVPGNFQWQTPPAY